MTNASPALAPSFAAAEDGLARIAGLAPSAVLRRRLERHAALLDALSPDPSDSDPAWAALLDAVTVQETRLFRAASQLAAIADRLPTLVRGDRPLRILSAGCATGEEAWSLAVLAAEAGLPAEVTGLDLCRPALRVAEAGRYGPGPPDPLREVPDAWGSRFDRADGTVAARLPDDVAVRFRRANLLDPPDDLPAFHVALCRNVLIYLLPEARDAVLRGLLAHLAPGGILVLGATDSPPRGARLRALDRSRAIWVRDEGDGA